MAYTKSLTLKRTDIREDTINIHNCIFVSNNNINKWNFFIYPLPDCCSSVIVHHHENSTQVHDQWKEIFQEYELQSNSFNGRSYYIGKNDSTEAIAFGNCDLWTIQETSERLVLIMVNLGQDLFPWKSIIHISIIVLFFEAFWAQNLAT